jgi:hypothetical protein
MITGRASAARPKHGRTALLGQKTNVSTRAGPLNVPAQDQATSPKAPGRPLKRAFLRCRLPARLTVIPFRRCDMPIEVFGGNLDAHRAEYLALENKLEHAIAQVTVAGSDRETRNRFSLRPAQLDDAVIFRFIKSGDTRCHLPELERWKQRGRLPCGVGPLTACRNPKAHHRHSKAHGIHPSGKRDWLTLNPLRRDRSASRAKPAIPPRTAVRHRQPPKASSRGQSLTAPAPTVD